jgi:hypothetical protein
MKKVKIYTDGSCPKNPGRGGYATLLIYESETIELTGTEEDSTNNRMEIMGVISGLEALGDIRAREKRIADGLADDNVKKLTEYAYDFLGGAVPLQQIQRRIAYFSDSPNIQQWIEQLLEEENRPPSK